MFFNNSSGRSVAALASIISIMISEGLTADEIDVLAGLFSAIGSNLALISIVETGRLPTEEGETITVDRNSTDSGQTYDKQNDENTEESGEQAKDGADAAGGKKQNTEDSAQSENKASKNGNKKEGPAGSAK